MYAPVSDIPKEIISHFWQTGEISERAKQKGLQYAFEGYIHDIICNRLENNFIKIEAKAYNVRSQHKQQPPNADHSNGKHKLRNSYVHAQQGK